MREQHGYDAGTVLFFCIRVNGEPAYSGSLLISINQRSSTTIYN